MKSLSFTPASRAALALLLAVTTACADDPQPSATRAGDRAGLVVTDVADDGSPRLVRATSMIAAPKDAAPPAAARAHLATYARAFNLPAEAVAALQLQRVHRLQGGATVVTLQPVVDGLEVFRGEVAVLMRANNSLVAVKGAPRRGALPTARVRATDQRLAVADAVAIALADYSGQAVTAADVIDRGLRNGDFARGERLLNLRSTAALKLAQPVRARLMLFADGGSLVPVWWVEAWAVKRGSHSDQTGVFVAVVDARNGHIHVREDRNASESFNFRVWQNGADKRPADGPSMDFTPHPAGVANGSVPTFIAPTLTAMAGFNHNPQNTADSWLPTGATNSVGNNADVYTDDDSPDGFSPGDLRASVTAPNSFDYTYNVAAEPQGSTQQRAAAIVQAFYTVNWLHDWWYDSGFNEAAGNAQADNFGRGGFGGDVMHVETQNGAASELRNNANMSTASDGTSPRMQIFLWSGSNDATLTVTPGGDQATTGAEFGPPASNVTGTIVLANDGTAPVTDACQPISNNVAGKIVLIDRGACPFTVKAVAAEAAGAIAVIIANNVVNGGAMTMGQSQPPTTVNIPATAISLETGNALKAALANGTVTATMVRTATVERDGALDSSVVAHEWGHYLHHRLASCGMPQCAAMSEGWADFVALHMAMQPGDNLDGTFALAQYATAGSSDAFFGLRRAPYALDTAKNGFTFKHIADGAELPAIPLRTTGGPNSEVHNAGEIWAEWLFEAYVALLKTTQVANPTRTFDQVRRAMGDYIVAGLEMTPPDATFTEQRDAVLTAAAAVSDADAAVMAAAFARRGGGSCAQSPPRTSSSFVGVVEDFALAPAVTITDAKLDETIKSCDQDGVLDRGEAGRLTMTVHNSGAATLTGATLLPTTTTAGVTLPTAPIVVPDIAPFQSATIAFDVSLGVDIAPQANLQVALAVNAPGACSPSSTIAFTQQVNLDLSVASSATDHVETQGTEWTLTGANATDIWARVTSDAGSRVWHAVDFPSLSDSALVSPDLMVSSTEPLQLTFKERHDFEVTTEGPTTTYFDGAVIEISTDAGQNWTDIGGAAYGGTITNISGNPLANRTALVGKNAAFPAFDTVALNLGTTYAGKTVKVRFRLGTDQAGAATAWEIDDIAFTGITNTPFSNNVDNVGTCDKGSDDPNAMSDGGCCQVDGNRNRDAAGAAAMASLIMLVVLRRRRQVR